MIELGADLFTSSQHCLVVKHDQRYTVDEALKDAFFHNDEVCLQDINELEDKVGSQWISPILRLMPQESIDVENEDSNNNYS